MDKHNRFHFPAVAFLLIAGLFLWSWQQWSSTLVDAGYNFYTLWRMSEGDALYRDIAYYHGPLSPYLLSTILSVIGVSILNLALIGAGLTWGLSCLLFLFFEKVYDRGTGLAASLFFLFVFAFSQYVGIENYNYLVPYKFEAVHGMLLGLGFFWVAAKSIENNSRGMMFLLGFLPGLSLLTSTEIAFANLAALLVFLGVSFPRFCREKHPRWPILAGFFLPSLLAFGLFTLRFPAAEAFRHTFTAELIPILYSGIAKNNFYTWTLGLGDVRGNLALQAWAAGGALCWLGFFAALDRAGRKLPGQQQLFIGATLGFAPFVLRFLFPSWSFWVLDFGRLLPPVGFACALWSIVRWRDTLAQPKLQLEAVWIVWSMALLGKMILFPRIYHYGFYLAMPACLLLIAKASHSLPALLKRKWENGAFLRGAAFGLLFAAGLTLFLHSNEIYSRKIFRIGDGGDTIATNSPAEIPLHGVNWIALDWLRKNTMPGSTVLALPEATIFNYLARRVRPGPYTFNFVELLIHGEEKFLATWSANPPDFILLVHNAGIEFGFPPFGTSPEYGKATMDWIRAHYVETKLIGPRPFQTNNIQDYGILILKRRP